MPTAFHYEGRASNGSKVAGTLDALSIEEVVTHLNKQGIFPTDIKAVTRKNFDWKSLGSIKVFEQKPKTEDVMNFCRQMATLISAGVPLIRSLKQLANSAKLDFMKRALLTIADDVYAGVAFGAALKKHPEIFESMVINIVNIGETTGHLQDVLLQLGDYLEKSVMNHRRIKSAMRYPIFAISAILIAIFVMSFFVIPKFSGLFSRAHMELPLPTKIILGFSNFLINDWWILLASVVIFIIGLARLLKVPEVRYKFDKYMLSMPIFGDLTKRISISQFIWTFSLILRAGVPVIKGISLAANATKNTYFSRQLILIGDAINIGENFSRAVANSGLFTSMALQMIEVGDESGKLDEMLSEVAKYYDAEIDYKMKNLSETIEPVLISCIAAIVVILALGIYMPMWQMMKVMH